MSRMRNTWRVGRDSVRAVTRAQASARAERFAKGVYGCVAAYAKGPGPSRPRRTTICRLSIAGWQREEDRNARPLRSPTSSWSLPITSCETELVTATSAQTTFDRLNPEGLRRRLTKRLEGLGFKVTLEPLAQVA